jgi:hypothetical protein
MNRPKLARRNRAKDVPGEIANYARDLNALATDPSATPGQIRQTARAMAGDLGRANFVDDDNNTELEKASVFNQQEQKKIADAIKKAADAALAEQAKYQQQGYPAAPRETFDAKGNIIPASGPEVGANALPKSTAKSGYVGAPVLSGDEMAKAVPR